MKCEGIQGIRRLAKHHPEVLVTQLHTVTLAVIAEVRCQIVTVIMALLSYRNAFSRGSNSTVLVVPLLFMQ